VSIEKGAGDIRPVIAIVTVKEAEVFLIGVVEGGKEIDGIGVCGRSDAWQIERQKKQKPEAEMAKMV
jgi:hypothetical protein